MLGAITSTQQKLKLYNRIPENGLVLYCGMILTDDGKEKRVNIDFEPFKPINTSLYLCDNKFHTEVSTSNEIQKFSSGLTNIPTDFRGQLQT